MCWDSDEVVVRAASSTAWTRCALREAWVRQLQAENEREVKGHTHRHREAACPRATARARTGATAGCPTAVRASPTSPRTHRLVSATRLDHSLVNPPDDSFRLFRVQRAEGPERSQNTAQVIVKERRGTGRTSTQATPTHLSPSALSLLTIPAAEWCPPSACPPLRGWLSGNADILRCTQVTPSCGQQAGEKGYRVPAGARVGPWPASP
jgi:hypothetical protein